MTSYLGIHPDLSNEDYHKDSAISRSGIMAFADSPYKYWAQYINPNRPPKKQTIEMAFGTAFHTFMLENDKYSKNYIVKVTKLSSPARVYLKNVGRPAYDAYKAEKAKVDFINDSAEERFAELAEGKIVLDAEEVMILEAMRASILGHSQAADLIFKGKIEHSIFWQDKESGLMVKARPDVWFSNMVVDLKTCKSAKSRAFQYTMIDAGYHIQAAMIRDGVLALTGTDITAFLNLCVEKLYPYSIGIKIIGEQALEEGKRFYKQKLIEMKSAFENNDFPDYEPETVELPNWY